MAQSRRCSPEIEEMWPGRQLSPLALRRASKSPADRRWNRCSGFDSRCRAFFDAPERAQPGKDGCQFGDSLWFGTGQRKRNGPSIRRGAHRGPLASARPGHSQAETVPRRGRRHETVMDISGFAPVDVPSGRWQGLQQRGSFSLRSEGKRKLFDFKGVRFNAAQEPQKMEWRGIYEFEGDFLKICYRQRRLPEDPAVDRPDSFVGERGRGGTTSVTLRPVAN